jgi:glycosyltransferase involved in cell wall biosynthesis
MPTYNRGALIANAIQSILDQTFEDWELVIVDDGSNDQTLQVVKLFPDPRIKYHQIRHQGVARALNFGNEQCQGEIIVKQDSDDASLPNRLEVINREMKTDFFYHSYYHLFLEPRTETMCRIFRSSTPVDEDRLLKEQYIPGTFAYTKEFSKEVPYRELICSEDWMLILDAVFKKKSIGFINEGLYEYVLHLDSNSIANEKTGSYESDEKKMKEIMKVEYGKDFTYSKRP